MIVVLVFCFWFLIIWKFDGCLEKMNGLVFIVLICVNGGFCVFSVFIKVVSVLLWV